jgi:hypothetical protein
MFSATVSESVVTTWEVWVAHGQVGLSDGDAHTHGDAVLACSTDGGTLLDLVTYPPDTDLGAIMLNYKSQSLAVDYNMIWTLGSSGALSIDETTQS